MAGRIFFGKERKPCSTEVVEKGGCLAFLQALLKACQMFSIQPYSPEFQQQVIDLILSIEIDELHVPITLDDQPDLLEIPNFYQSKRGNFWIAVNPEQEVVGTIALIDVDRDFGVIRKMFVRSDYRGKEFSTALNLYQRLETWAIENQFGQLILGTHSDLKPAIRFYQKLGFVEILKKGLPEGFPVMEVNDVFFKKRLG